MPRAFRLEVGAEGLATLTFDLPEKRANIFTRPVLEELEALIGELALRTEIAVLVLLSGKPNIFIAGADVEEIARVRDAAEATDGSRAGQRILSAWEALPFPTVAAIRGSCVGGGTELALASDWIVLSDREDLRIGLPEVRLGILPGWGGCTRLPRRVGILAALDVILAGKTIPARRAFNSGLADALYPEATFLHHVRDFAISKSGRKRLEKRPPRGWRNFLLEGNPLGRAFVFDQAKKKTLRETKGRYPAPLAALEAVKIGVEKGMPAGYEAEATRVGTLATGEVAKNLIHVFQLMEGAKKEAGEVPAPVERAGVLGAGVMGGGIAQLVADATNRPVRMKDIQPRALATAMSHAASLWEKAVRRRRITRAAMGRKMALLEPTLSDAGFAGCDLIVEAVVEKLEVKQAVFAGISAIVPAATVLASNTSSLSIDAIAASTIHPERVVGMHFFNPVDRMPLVEVISGKRSGAEAARRVAAYARKLGKTPVQVRDGPGFLVNRLLSFYSAEAMWLLDEGYRVEAIDRAMLVWGMPMGPLRLADEVGLDVGAKVAHILHGAFPERLVYPDWMDRIASEGRLGVKTGLGIYRYEGRKEKEVDPAAYAVLGIRPTKNDPDLAVLAERMVLPMVNEAARCLVEAIVEGPGPLDLAMIMGTGFPPFRGGLCRWADSLGLGEIVTRLEELAARSGARLAPSDALRRFAASGGFYSRQESLFRATR